MSMFSYYKSQLLTKINHFSDLVDDKVSFTVLPFVLNICLKKKIAISYFCIQRKLNLPHSFHAAQEA